MRCLRRLALEVQGGCVAVRRIAGVMQPQRGARPGRSVDQSISRSADQPGCCCRTPAECGTPWLTAPEIRGGCQAASRIARVVLPRPGARTGHTRWSDIRQVKRVKCLRGQRASRQRGRWCTTPAECGALGSPPPEIQGGCQPVKQIAGVMQPRPGARPSEGSGAQPGAQPGAPGDAGATGLLAPDSASARSHGRLHTGHTDRFRCSRARGTWPAPQVGPSRSRATDGCNRVRCRRCQPVR